MNEDEEWEYILCNRDLRAKTPYPWEWFDGTCACVPHGCCEASSICNDCFGEVELNGAV